MTSNLETDVLLLADVFENFRNVCLTTYELDSTHYYTRLSGLSWDAMLKHTQIQLELIYDIDMYQMLEKGICGDIAFITHKHVKANNPYVPGYDASKLSNYQMYFDANNLYGWAMSQSLPECGFAWVDEQESVDYMNVSENAETWYILEVDLEYSAEIHDQHNDYLMAPEKRS